MIRRPLRSIPAVLVALVVLAVCVLAATSAIQQLLGTQPLIGYDAITGAAGSVRWNEVVIAIGGVVLGVLGLVLVLAAVLPGKPVVLPLATSGAAFPMDAGVRRSSLRTNLRAAVHSVDGVAGATVKLRRRKIATKVTTHRTTTDGLADAVRAALQQRVDRIAPARTPELRVRVVSTRSSR
ncbi:MAG: DUF6286 domain-containing protein [Haloechinothrix sp.]